MKLLVKPSFRQLKNTFIASRFIYLLLVYPPNLSILRGTGYIKQWTITWFSVCFTRSYVLYCQYVLGKWNELTTIMIDWRVARDGATRRKWRTVSALGIRRSARRAGSQVSRLRSAKQGTFAYGTGAFCACNLHCICICNVCTTSRLSLPPKWATLFPTEGHMSMTKSGLACVYFVYYV